MFTYNKINKRIFSPGRLIFFIPEAPKSDVAEAAKAEELRKANLDAAVTELATSPDDKTADKILQNATDKINALSDVSANPATKTEAVKLLNQNLAALNAAKKYIGDRVAVKLALEDYDKQTDFWGKGVAFAALKKLEATVLSLKGSHPEDDQAAKYEAAKIAYKKEAEDVYKKLSDTYEQLIASSTTEQKPNEQAYLTQMANLQRAIYENLPGLDDNAKNDLKAKFNTYIGTIQATLEASQDDEVKRQVKMLKFANQNFEGAQKETNNAGHLEGAKQYMEMVLAEQTVREVWSQLPFDSKIDKSWRAANIETAIEPGQGWGANMPDYNAAVESFKQAKDLSLNRATGDSVKAKDLFKKSADLFGSVLANAKKAEKKEEEPEKTPDVATVSEEAKKARTDFIAKYGNDSWAASVIKQTDEIAKLLSNRPGISDDFNVSLNKDIARIYTESGPAIEANHRIDTAWKEYQKAHTVDITANIIYQDGARKFDSGNFKEAAIKLNECAQIYEAINAGTADASKSNAVIDEVVKEGTQEQANTSRANAEWCVTTAAENPSLTKLLKNHFDVATAAMKEKYWARAINQFQQVIEMTRASDNTFALYLELREGGGSHTGEEAFDLIQQANKYYDAGSFAEAKTYYENAKKILTKVKSNNAEAIAIK
jgi:tetratricopeptide (TPR) repeat protein